MVVSIAQDTAGIQNAITDFAASYNAVISAINLQYKVDPNTYAVGELASDSTLRSIQSSLLSDVTYAISDNGGITGLASIGVKMQDDGTLMVDDAKLASVLNNNLAQVQNLFQSIHPAGFASNFAADLGRMTSSAGPISTDLAQIALQQKTLTDQITHLEDQLAVKRTRLINEYSQVNAALQLFPVLMQQITGQLGILTNGK